ncbi:N6-Methyl-AMP deaminase-like [Oculina patagonica]
MADSAGKTSEERIPFNFFKKIPKVELHAHINGSISAETIEKLIKRKSGQVNNDCLVSQWQTTIQKEDKRDLDECFALFGIIYQLVDDTEAVFLVRV